jgi:hypothetical protein
MPFVEEIIDFINDSLKAGSLKKEKLQPVKLYGLSTIIPKKDIDKPLQRLPAIVDPLTGKYTAMAPDSKLGLQAYHKLLNKVYSYEKKSHGDDHFIKCTSELAMVVFTNSKITQRSKAALEPLLLFGMPQKLSDALMTELKIISCLITPLSSNMDAMSVFQQEYPQSDYFLTEQISMFLTRYKIEMTFSQQCVEQCLCG